MPCYNCEARNDKNGGHKKQEYEPMERCMKVEEARERT